MDLIGNFKRVVMEHYVDFKGRARRAEFWQFVLVYFIIAFILSLIPRLSILVSLLGLALLLPNLGVTVRRLHDVGTSGWMILLPMVPGILGGIFFMIFYPLALVFILAMLAAEIYLIYLLAKPGISGSNQYGPDPKGAM